MNIERKESEHEVIFLIMDELVTGNIVNLADEFNRFVRTDTRDAVLDLTYVRKIDSIAIAALIRFKNSLMEDNRSLNISNPNETVLRVLELSGMEKFLLE